jgi:hypothetical protein
MRGRKFIHQLALIKLLFGYTYSSISAFNHAEAQIMKSEALYIINNRKHIVNQRNVCAFLNISFSSSLNVKNVTEVKENGISSGFWNSTTLHHVSVNLLRIRAGPDEFAYIGFLGGMHDDLMVFTSRKSHYLMYATSRVTILDNTFFSKIKLMCSLLGGASYLQAAALEEEEEEINQKKVNQSLDKLIISYIKTPFDQSYQNGHMCYTYGFRMDIELNKFFSINIMQLFMLPFSGDISTIKRPAEYRKALIKCLLSGQNIRSLSVSFNLGRY